MWLTLKNSGKFIFFLYIGNNINDNWKQSSGLSEQFYTGNCEIDAWLNLEVSPKILKLDTVIQFKKNHLWRPNWNVRR